MRPTGRLHLGHFVGALKNWARLQEQYDCFYFVADWHALTSEYANTEPLVGNALDNVADWIAAGVDPERSTIFVQSLVPEHAELSLLLSMVVPVPWLERVPTYKEQGVDFTFPPYTFTLFFNQNTPQDVIDLWDKVAREVTADPAYQKDVASIGMVWTYKSPQDSTAAYANAQKLMSTLVEEEAAVAKQ